MEFKFKEILKYFKKYSFVILFILATNQNFAQSSYSLGAVTGYDKEFGANIGFLFEYKLENTNATLQFLSESNRLDYLITNNPGNPVSFNMIGIKVNTNLLNNLYFLPDIGIMIDNKVDNEVIFDICFSVGYNIELSKYNKGFIQIGANYPDNTRTFISLRFGIIFNL